jgi:hypothetical protein
VTSIGPWAAENASRLTEIRQTVEQSLGDGSALSDIVAATADHLKIAIDSPVVYYLTQTTVLACLSALEASGAAAQMVENRLYWRFAR